MGTAPNLEKLCRICTAEQTDNILIFSEEGKKLYLEAKMKKYLHIAVSVEDILPKMVCTNCCKKLDSIHRFACMAVKMQDKLKMLLETPSTEEVKKEHSILHSILSKYLETAGTIPVELYPMYKSLRGGCTFGVTGAFLSVIVTKKLCV